MKLVYGLVIACILLGCHPKPLPQDPLPEHDALEIRSEYVGEVRVINVWTPPSYEKGGTSYPVLYMPDGGLKEDFPHIANTIAQLVAQKSIPPLLLVGIENTDRKRDLTGASAVQADEKYCPITDGATNFRNFIVEELRPLINERYRTTEQSGLLGESLAGLFVVETFLQGGAPFDFYVAMDPSIWWNDYDLVKRAPSLLENLPDKPLKLWFAGSGAADINKHTRQLSTILEQHAPKQLTWTYSDEPKEHHHTIFRATKAKALKWTLNE